MQGTHAVIAQATTGNKRAEQEAKKDAHLMAILTVTDQDFVVVDLKDSSQDDSKSSGESQDEEKLQPVLRRRAVKTMMGGWRSQPFMTLYKTSPIVMPNEVMGKAYSSDDDLEVDTVDGSQDTQASSVSSKPKRAQSGECMHRLPHWYMTWHSAQHQVQ